MTTETINNLKWKRLGPGAYESNPNGHKFLIVRRVIPAGESGGYGRRDDWVVAHTGPDGFGGYDRDYANDPDPTFAEAKRTAHAWFEATV
jgi:hypothetical protein